MDAFRDELMNIVIVGHVDHGKSTVIGRLLADTGSLPEGKLESVKAECERNSKPFEYAFLLDALKDEQSQGITIDSARVFFKSDQRHYLILDAPGHIEFLKNMITGASRAEAALLVIDAAEGVKENSRRHGYMLSMLGIKQVAVLVNKMDLAGYEEKRFNEIRDEYDSFLEKIGLQVSTYIPVSGMEGENIVSLSKKMGWYTGGSVLETLDSFKDSSSPVNKPFRMPVQDIYKFTRFGDSRRIVAGNVDAGSITVGDEVMFFPSGKKSTVSGFAAFNTKEPETLTPGMAAGLMLKEQIYITRGEIAVKAGELHPSVSTRFKVSLFWLSRNPMVTQKEYTLKVGTSKNQVRIEKILHVLDASNLEEREKSEVERHDVAEVILVSKKAIAFDPTEEGFAESRFVIIDNYEISGGGIIRTAMEDYASDIRNYIKVRNYKWEKGNITMSRRAIRYSQKPSLVIITGPKSDYKKELAKSLEEQLFNEGRLVYYLGIGSVKYGLDADLSGSDESSSREHIRRLAETANIIVDLGAVLIVTATGLNQDHLEIIRATINPDMITTIVVGDLGESDFQYDYYFSEDDLGTTDCVARIREGLQEKGVFFRPWV